MRARRPAATDAQTATLRWLSVGSFFNAATSSVLATAQTGLGLTLAPSRAALLARMSLLVGVSAAILVLILPLCGKISDSAGRKPIIVGRATFSLVVGALLAARPSYLLLCVWRTCSNFSWTLWQTAVNASLADVFEGQELAVAIAKIDAQQGAAMLVGPLVGGRMAEYSFRACFALSAIMGGVGVLVYTLGYRETLKPRPSHEIDRPANDPAPSFAARVLAAVPNPLGFLRLFRSGPQLAALTAAWTLSEMWVTFASGRLAATGKFPLFLAHFRSCFPWVSGVKGRWRSIVTLASTLSG